MMMMNNYSDDMVLMVTIKMMGLMMISDAIVMMETKTKLVQ